MGLQTIIPGDKAIHRATGVFVQVMSYADGRFDCRAYDGPGLSTAVVSGPVDAFEPYSPKAADEGNAAWLEKWLSPDNPANQATATEIARLQAQVSDLQKKLQQAEASRDAAASRAAELLAQPSPTPRHLGEGQGVGTIPRVETMIHRNVNERGLARYLNEGWGILHMQFVGLEDEDGESEDRLNVVLQRAAVVAPAPAPVRTVTGTVVPMSQQIGDDDEYEAEDVPPLPALDPDPLMPTPPLPVTTERGLGGEVSAADFTKAVLAARLSTEDTLAMLNNRLKSVARDAYTAFPAPAPRMPLGAVK